MLNFPIKQLSAASHRAHYHGYTNKTTHPCVFPPIWCMMSQTIHLVAPTSHPNRCPQILLWLYNTLGSAPIPHTLISNSKQDNSEEFKCLLFSTLPSPPSLTLTLSLHNNQLLLHASHLHLHCTSLSNLIPLILLLLYHHYPCSFPFVGNFPGT